MAALIIVLVVAVGGLYYYVKNAKKETPVNPAPTEPATPTEQTPPAGN